jgi:hypothetical protein
MTRTIEAAPAIDVFARRYHVQGLRFIARCHPVGLVDSVPHALLKVCTVDLVTLHLNRQAGGVDWLVASVDMATRRRDREVILSFRLIVNHVDSAVRVHAERMMDSDVCVPVGTCRDVEHCTVRCAFKLVQCAGESFEQVARGAVRCDAVGSSTAESVCVQCRQPSSNSGQAGETASMALVLQHASILPRGTGRLQQVARVPACSCRCEQTARRDHDSCCPAHHTYTLRAGTRCG